jgi:TOM7 family
MARSFAAFKKNVGKGLEKLGEYTKRAIYYGFIPGLLYLGLTTEPKPNLKLLLGL